MVLATDYWKWHAHPEVWVLVASLLGLYFWAERNIGPKMVPEGTPPISRSQKRWFVSGVLVLWVNSDWPVHDIGERYLYTVHMYQHLVFTLVIPPMLLLGIPEWLARLVVGESRAQKVLRWLCRPVPAAVIFNLLFLFSHWPSVFDEVTTIGWMHYSMHAALLTTGIFMWMCVVGPIEEWRISLPASMIYLFAMSVAPTVPAAWLTFSSTVVYKVYDTKQRMWGISAISDQQMAGLLMKLGETAYLWTLITIRFFKWARRNEEAERRGRSVTERELLTWDQVASEFDALGPPLKETEVD